MRLIGPNCMGVVNTAPDVRLHATFAPVAPPPGVVGLVSQSGPLGIGILGHTRQRGLGLSTFVAVGNRADVSSNDLLQFWEGDERTRVVLLYLETFGNPAKFSRMARRLSQVKPIVAVKAGRSGEAAADALFRQTGIIRVDGLEQLFDTAQLLVEQPLPAGRRVAVVAHAGSALLAVDACVASGLELARLSSATEAVLAEPVGKGGSTANPVELAHPAGPAELETVVRAVLDDPGVDAVLSVFVPPSAGGREEVSPSLERARTGRDKPVLSIFFGGARPPGSTVSSFEFPEEAARALGRVADHAAWRRRPAGVVPPIDDADPDAARNLVTSALAAGGERVRLGLDVRLALLRCYRIEVAAARRAGTVEEAVAGAAEIGLPVALKAGGLERPGRTEAGGVAVDLQSLEEVAGAWARMSASLGPSLLPAVVQQMVASGVDLIVRVVQDPTFGPIISLGLGGAAADAMAAGPPHILPLTDVDAGEVVASSPAARLLVDGDRRPLVDIASLVDLLLRVSALVVAVPELAELRLNPVIVSAHGTAVVDVDAVVAPVLPPEPAVRRIR